MEIKRSGWTLGLEPTVVGDPHALLAHGNCLTCYDSRDLYLVFFFHLPSLSRTITDREEFHQEIAGKLQKKNPDKRTKAKAKAKETRWWRELAEGE